MSDVAAFFRAISDPTRQRILLLLEEKERCVGELVAEFSLSQPTVSKHLNILKQAGLVEDLRKGQQIYYSLGRQKLRRCCTEYFSRFRCCSDLFEKPNQPGG